MNRLICLAFAALALAGPAGAAPPEPAKPLFASDDIIRITIRGPVDTIAKAAEESRATYLGTLTVAGINEALGVQLAQRGITRRKNDVCQFPPLRVVFSQPPPASSLFAGQRKLKLVTHCRAAEAFQQYVLMEYATYKLYNQLTSLSFRARLATIDYVDAAGRPTTSRIGFFLEDIDDVAKRNGMREAKVGERIPVARLSPTDSGRVGVFEYMIGNLDWAMQAGPPGDNCCHNAPLIGDSGGSSPLLVSVPYDWDFSGLVDTPYATAPDAINVTSVRQRRYRGFCRFNAEARAAVVDARARQAPLMATFASVPGMDPRTVKKATAYLSGFFADIATDAIAEAKLIKTCL
ncbi:MAG: hypothetical protein LH610_06015 [Sphingomonas bacterium]|nr:hypothetical protein [Sphingomonas bacterium]